MLVGLLFCAQVIAGTAPDGTPTPAAAATAGQATFLAVGDFSTSAEAAATLESMGRRQADLSLALGDFSYRISLPERSWCDFVTTRVGATHPFELISGDHESNGENGKIAAYADCLPNRIAGLRGTYAKEFYVDFPVATPTIRPLVRFILLSPALTFPEGTYSYAAGSTRYQWTARAIDDARAAGIPWVVVGMHKPCLSLGVYSCEPGTDLLNLLVQRKVDLVLTGHEHLYQRSKQLRLGTRCPAIAPMSFNADCVADAGSAVVKGAGSVLVTVGTGGVPLRDVALNATADPEYPYFAATAGLNRTPTHGYLSVSATTDRLTGTFIPTNGGSFADVFSVTRPTSAFAADTFTRSTASGFGSAPTGGIWTVSPTSLTSRTSVSAGSGVIRLDPGVDVKGVRLDAATAQSTDLRATIWPETAVTGGGVYLGVIGRRTSAGDYRGNIRLLPNGVVRVGVARASSTGVETALQSAVAIPEFPSNTGRLAVRLQVTGSAPTTLRLKVWPATGPEPASWQSTATDSTAGLQGPGSTGIRAYLSGTSGTGATTVRVDDWVARPVV